MPIGTELDVTVLFLKELELGDFNAVAKVVRKDAYRKEDWKGNLDREGYQYGLEFIQISEEDRLKLDLLLSGRYNLEEILTINEGYVGKEVEF